MHWFGLRTGLLIPGLVTLVIGVSTFQLPMSAANAYTETFMHLRPSIGDLGAFAFDLYLEDEDFNASFAETLPVKAIRLVIQTDHPSGLSKADLSNKAKQEFAMVAVKLVVGIEPGDTRATSGILTGQLACQITQAPPRYDLSAIGLHCPTEYDAGDAGEFFIEPIFGDEGFAASFDVHFRVVAQKTSDREGTPAGPPFVGALLNGHQDSLEQSVTGSGERLRNARPLLRLKDPAKPLVLNFSTYARPDE